MTSSADFPQPAGQLVLQSSIHVPAALSSTVRNGQQEPIKQRQNKGKQTIAHAEQDPSRSTAVGLISTRNSTEPQQTKAKRSSNVPVSKYDDLQLSRESFITAEVKTNVVIKDEYGFITELSNHLAQRYQRAQNSIIVHLQHSVCLFFGGSFDPAYILVITALPSQVQTTINKRNASLIQQFFAENLDVPMNRGVVCFNSIAAENYATNGNTVLGEMEEIENAQRNRSYPKNGRTKHEPGSRKNSTAQENKEPRAMTGSRSKTRQKAQDPHLPDTSPPQAFPDDIVGGQRDETTQSPKKLVMKRSIMNMFRR